MEPMHRSLSSKLYASLSYKSLRKVKDFGGSDEQEEAFSKENGNWAIRTLPERWRMTRNLDTPSRTYQQKVTIDLSLTTSYRKEGTNYIIRGEIFDILWDSNMFSNEDYCRGWFVDELQIRFQPLWSQEEIVCGALFPPTSNASAYFGNSNAVGITGYICRNPSIAVTMTNTKSQQTSQPMYKCKWERGPNGRVSFIWKLNLWCPSSDLQYPKLYNPSRGWSGAKVPMLPPDYEKGNFNGLDFKPSVEWVVPAAIVRAGQAAWCVTVSAHVSFVSSRKRFILPNNQYFVAQSFSKSKPWRFSKRTSDHMEEWQSLSSSCRRSARHSRRNSS